MKAAERINIGTSGWHYDHWKGSFYPDDISAGEMLGFYAERLGTVEINNSFYQLPEDKTLSEWRDMVPEGFAFSAKASRYITHMKKLKDPQEPVTTFIERVKVLGDKLGPILFQLPPRWKLNLERLRSFLDVLPVGHKYTFEFRDPSWFAEEVYEALSARNAAFCIYELAGRLSPKKVTADFVYVRLHGPGDAYEGDYDAQTLAGWAGAFSTWAGKGLQVYCYFDNDQKGYAAQNALKLHDMLRH
ncbi:MAG: DUF72 domain-containing protein [Actinobacteria bacterium]|nr:DUF72 domain-containing protein [Actinomycetota bacterium]